MKPNPRPSLPAKPSRPAEKQLTRGHTRDEATFPAPPPVAGLPADYGTTLEAIK